MAGYSTYDDDRLIVLLRSGDHAAFTEIYHRYWEKLADAAYNRLNCRDDADEVIQELFVDLYIRREKINPKSTLEAYLKTALKYKVIDVYRSQQLQLSRIDQLLEKAGVPVQYPSDELERKELQKIVMRSTEKLPKKCRQVFLMSRFQQLSLSEIAIREGITISTVNKHLHKAMLILRQEFKTHPLVFMFLCAFNFLR